MKPINTLQKKNLQTTRSRHIRKEKGTHMVLVQK